MGLVQGGLEGVLELGLVHLAAVHQVPKVQGDRLFQVVQGHGELQLGDVVHLAGEGGGLGAGFGDGPGGGGKAQLFQAQAAGGRVNGHGLPLLPLGGQGHIAVLDGDLDPGVLESVGKFRLDGGVTLDGGIVFLKAAVAVDEEVPEVYRNILGPHLKLDGVVRIGPLLLLHQLLQGGLVGFAQKGAADSPAGGKAGLGGQAEDLQGAGAGGRRRGSGGLKGGGGGHGAHGIEEAFAHQVGAGGIAEELGLEGVDLGDKIPVDLLLPLQLLLDGLLLVDFGLGAGKELFHHAFGVHTGSQAGEALVAAGAVDVGTACCVDRHIYLPPFLGMLSFFKEIKMPVLFPLRGAPGTNLYI